MMGMMMRRGRRGVKHVHGFCGEQVFFPGTSFVEHDDAAGRVHGEARGKCVADERARGPPHPENAAHHMQEFGRGHGHGGGEATRAALKGHGVVPLQIERGHAVGQTHGVAVRRGRGAVVDQIHVLDESLVDFVKGDGQQHRLVGRGERKKEADERRSREEADSSPKEAVRRTPL